MATLTPNDPRHGTRYGYDHGKCRCAPCKKAKAKSQAEFRARKQGLPAGDPRHGTHNGYGNYGCRCTLCVAAEAEYTAALRGRRKELSGSTKTPLTGARAVGTVEHDALRRLTDRYQTASGQLHRAMIERMLPLAVDRGPWHPDDPPATEESIRQGLARKYGDKAPKSGYSQDITDVMCVERLRDDRNVLAAVNSSLFRPSPVIAPLLKDVAEQLTSILYNIEPSPRRTRLSLGVMADLAKRPDINGNTALLHAFLDTEPPIGWDRTLLWEACVSRAAWDDDLVARMLKRYDRYALDEIGLKPGYPGRVMLAEKNNLIDVPLAFLLAQRGAPQDRAVDAVPHLVSLCEWVIDTEPDDAGYWGVLGAVLNDQCPLRPHLPQELLSRALISLALT